MSPAQLTSRQESEERHAEIKNHAKREFGELLKLVRRAAKKGHDLSDENVKADIWAKMEHFTQWAQAQWEYRESIWQDCIKKVQMPAAQGAPKANTIEEARKIVEQDILESFSDETGDPWAQFQDETRTRFAAVESEAFKDWLRVSINDYAGRPQEGWVEPLVKLFASKARRRGKRTLHLRRATIDGSWYFQLTEDEVLIITGGVLHVAQAPPIFRSFVHQDAMAVDLSATPKDLELLDRYLNLTDAWELALFKSILPAYLVPGIPKPIQLSRGEPGSGKSIFSQVIKRIIDPSSTMREGINFPGSPDEWFVISRQHDVIICDNLSYISKEQQDESCRFVTGNNIQKRKLYTDAETVAVRLKGILVLNAIDLTNLSGDFIDRAIIWDLKRIEDRQRIPEETFWADFERDLPKIRGALFAVLARAKEIVATTPAPDLRLKDFARYAAACAVARGQDSAEFARQLQLKAELQKDETITQSPLLGPLETFMQTRDTWEGTATKLHQLLTEQEYGDARNAPKTWLKDAAALGIELRRTGFLLGRLGLAYDRKSGTKSGTKGYSMIALRKISEKPSTPSTLSTLSTDSSGGGVVLEEVEGPPTLNPKQLRVEARLRVPESNPQPASSDGGASQVEGVETISSNPQKEPRIRSAQQVMDFLRHRKRGSKTEEILAAVPVDVKNRERWLVATLKTLAKRGEIFSDKPDHWRALE